MTEGKRIFSQAMSSYGCMHLMLDACIWCWMHAFGAGGCNEDNMHQAMMWSQASQMPNHEPSKQLTPKQIASNVFCIAYIMYTYAYLPCQTMICRHCHQHFSWQLLLWSGGPSRVLWAAWHHHDDAHMDKGVLSRGAREDWSDRKEASLQETDAKTIHVLKAHLLAKSNLLVHFDPSPLMH